MTAVVAVQVAAALGESIYDQKTPNLKNIDTEGFCRILVEFVVLNNRLKVYPNLTSGKG